MRFSETLRFNANPDWWVYYVPYEELKHLIEQLRHLHQAIHLSNATAVSVQETDESTDDDVEQASPPRPMQRTFSQRVLSRMHEGGVRAAGYSAALGGVGVFADFESEGEGGLRERFEEKDRLFFGRLEKSKKTVDEFFLTLRDELEEIGNELEGEVARVKKMMEGEGLVEGMPLLRSPGGYSGGTLEDESKVLKRRLVAHYKELGETVNFSTLNRTAFDKILKKHDKYTGLNSRAAFMEGVLRESAFVDTSELEVLQKQTERLYGDIFKNGDSRSGREELREGLRDLIIWDRNTVWRDVLRTERKVSAVRAVKGGRALDIEKESSKVMFTPKLAPLSFSVVAFFAILLAPQIVRSLVVDGGKEYSDEILDAANRCLAVTVSVVILWAFEGIPLYVTSFLVIPLMILCHVFLDSEGKPLEPDKASSQVFEALSSPTLLLIICVYALGAALSKFELDKFVANRILTRIRKPHYLLLAAMTLAVFVSMFVSNVAAPVLLNSVMMPTIDAMSQTEGNRKYVRCLLLGIMAASNIGGFASPIASPQSAVALGLLTGTHKISFLKWLLVALPQCAVMVAVFYAGLYILYKPQKHILPTLPRFSENFQWPHWVTTGTLLVTVLIWSDHTLQNVFGSAGVVAVIPVLVFFGSGILRKEDFNNLPWDVVYLVAGGGVLGAAVESCKLLDLVAEKLTATIGTSSLYLIYVIFSAFMAAVANAVSHTVSSIIVLPLIFKIGEPMGHPQLLVLTGTFAASCAMALPISSFPNISATQVQDEKGEAYLSPRDVLRVGSLMTFLAVVILLSLGYVWMIALGL
eukprot:GFKZ01011042.1.p1 GENE.GFKZ01011042.1~~GFKZ01011042.1.p1  ORF type:complete len:809 (+),score=112.16 GFKZ01011042.1:133-2559(+)